MAVCGQDRVADADLLALLASNKPQLEKLFQYYATIVRGVVVVSPLLAVVLLTEPPLPSVCFAERTG